MCISLKNSRQIENDVLVVETEDKEEVLIPFIRKVYIEKIDLAAKKIIVDWQLDW